MIEVYTDGSCKPTNPGPAGFGVAVLVDKKLYSLTSEYIGVATNNVAEIMGVRYALIFLKSLGWEWEEVVIYTDSQYVIGLFEKNWNAKANQELVAEVRQQLEMFPNLEFRWVKGHDGNKYNEVVDKLASLITDSMADLDA